MDISKLIADTMKARELVQRTQKALLPHLDAMQQAAAALVGDGSAMTQVGRALDATRRRMQLDGIADQIGLTVVTAGLQAKEIECAIDDSAMTRAARIFDSIQRPMQLDGVADRMGLTAAITAGQQAKEIERDLVGALPTFIEAAQRAELAGLLTPPILPNLTASLRAAGLDPDRLTAPILPQMAAALEAAQIAPAILEQIRGSSITDGIAASFRSVQQFERSLALPRMGEEIGRALDVYQAQWSSVGEALQAAQAAGLSASLYDDMAGFAARAEKRTRRKPAGTPPTEILETLAVEADRIVASAKTEPDRAIARYTAYTILVTVAVNIASNFGTEALKALWPYLVALFIGVTNPTLPHSPGLLPEIWTPQSQPVGMLARIPAEERRRQRLPVVIRRAGERAEERTLEFFTAEIRNPNTRRAYVSAVTLFFRWCDALAIELDDIRPFTVATYIEGLGRQLAAPAVKQHLAAIRALFDYLVAGQVIPMNPAASVRGPKHNVKKGKTPVLNSDEARVLLDAIDTGTIIGLRDRALIGTMVYTFARVGAALLVDVEDCFIQGRRGWIRLHEKGGKPHEVPCHHKLERFLDEYIAAAGITGGVLFRTVAGRTRTLTENRLQQPDAYRMIQRRAAAAGIKTKIGNHTFRAMGIAAYLKNGGTLEIAQHLANHESPRTTKRYDRRQDDTSLDEIERIVI